MIKGAAILDWIGGLPKEVRTVVLAATTEIKTPTGAMLYHRNEIAKGLYRIVEGRVRLFSLTECGREILLKTYQPGESIGDLATLDGFPYPLFAETVTPCELRFLSADRFHELRREFPVINEALIIYMARSTRTLISFIEQSTFLPMLGRVAARLGFLVDEAEARGESVSTLKIPQKDIGLMVGASRQAVNKALSALQQQGVLTTQYGAVLIKDVARLRSLGEGVGDVTEADLPQDMM